MNLKCFEGVYSDPCGLPLYGRALWPGWNETALDDGDDYARVNAAAARRISYYYNIDDEKYILRSDPVRKSVRLGKTSAHCTHTHTARLSIIIDVLTRSTFRARKYCLANNRTLLTAVRAESSLSHARRSAFPPSHPRRPLIHTASLTLSLFALGRSSSIASHVVRRRRFYRRRHRRVLPFPRSLGDANINNTRVRSV